MQEKTQGRQNKSEIELNDPRSWEKTQNTGSKCSTISKCG